MSTWRGFYRWLQVHIAQVAALIAIIFVIATLCYATYYLRPINNNIYKIMCITAAEVLFALWLVPIAQRPQSVRLTAKELFDCETEARKTLAQIVAGAFLLLGFAASVNTLVLQRHLGDLQEDGRLNEQFTKAIDQLSTVLPSAIMNRSGEVQVNRIARLGSIYELEQIAKDEPFRYCSPVKNVLTEYINQALDVEHSKLLKSRADSTLGITVDVWAAREVIYNLGRTPHCPP